MKNQTSLALVCILAAATILGCNPANAGGGGGKTYSIGDTGPAGGMIVYDKGSTSNGWRYLEAAPTDQVSSSSWAGGPLYGIVTGASGTSVGTGQSNTAAIISKLGAGTYAANYCQTSINGYTDWFMPSRDELVAMLQTLESHGYGYLILNHSYWSSSEMSGSSATGAVFDGSAVNVWGTEDKTYSMRVRAVRAF